MSGWNSVLQLLLENLFRSEYGTLRSIRALIRTWVTSGADYKLELLSDCLPPYQLTRILELTCTVSSISSMSRKSFKKQIMFFVTIAYVPCNEFSTRVDLRATRTESNYMIPPTFGEQTSISRDRFGTIWSHPMFGEAPHDL